MPVGLLLINITTLHKQKSELALVLFTFFDSVLPSFKKK